MDIHQVHRFLSLTYGAGLKVWIDGGWAVDAVLGRQTRTHSDLDIALDASAVPALRSLLAQNGFVAVDRPDSWAHNFVLSGPDGAVVDVHSFELHPDGSNRGGVPYRAEHLRGNGSIGGLPVACITPEYLVEFHTGYDIDETDWHDVKHLCDAFGLALPAVYEPFAVRESERPEEGA